MAGFITVRVIALRECDAQDRALLGLESHLLDRQVLFYARFALSAPVPAAAQAKYAKCASALRNLVDYHSPVLI